MQNELVESTCWQKSSAAISAFGVSSHYCWGAHTLFVRYLLISAFARVWDAKLKHTRPACRQFLVTRHCQDRVAFVACLKGFIPTWNGARPPNEVHKTAGISHRSILPCFMQWCYRPRPNSAASVYDVLKPPDTYHDDVLGLLARVASQSREVRRNAAFLTFYLY